MWFRSEKWYQKLSFCDKSLFSRLDVPLQKLKYFNLVWSIMHKNKCNATRNSEGSVCFDIRGKSTAGAILPLDKTD